MALNRRPYKGTRDLFPVKKREQNYLFQHMAKAAELYGYEPYDGPLIEDLDLYLAKSGEEIATQQVYSFTDRGNRQVAIRPEMTPTLARMAAQVCREAPLPLRWYSIPNLMRYERPQKGRLREHWQWNVDILGGPYLDSVQEIISVGITLLSNFGAHHQHFNVLVNDRNFCDALFHKVLGLDDDTARTVYQTIDRYKKVGHEKTMQDLKKLSIENLTLLENYLKISSWEELEDFLTQNQLRELGNDLTTLVEKFKSLQLLDYLKFDPSIVRGFDYYTGIVFEIFDKNKENPRAICGGGSYARLLDLFNEKLEGVGFGLGDVTLHDFLSGHNLLPDFSKADIRLFLFQENKAHSNSLSKLGSQLRNSGQKIMHHFGEIKFNKAQKLAIKRGAQYLGFVDEGNDSQLTIIDLQNKNRKNFSLNDISSIDQLISDS